MSFVLSSNPKSLDGLYAFARAMARGDRIGARAPREQPSRGGDLIDVDRQATSSVVSLLRCMLGAYPSTLSVQSYMPPSHLLPIRVPYLPTRGCCCVCETTGGSERTEQAASEEKQQH